MPARTTKFLSAVVVGALADVLLATMSYAATPEAADCLSGPKGEAHGGGHWHYRIDHATKRHCWYLKGEKAPQNAVADPAPAKTTPPNGRPPTQRSVADAHAELSGQPARRDGPAAAFDSPAATAAAQAPRPAVPPQWPMQSAVGSLTGPDPSVANADDATRSDPDVVPSSGTAISATASSAEKESGSFQTLLLVILGALGLAGLIGSAALRFGSLRWVDRRTAPVARQAIWQPVGDEGPSPPPAPNPRFRNRGDDVSLELQTAEDPSRIDEMLTRLARSATH